MSTKSKIDALRLSPWLFATLIMALAIFFLYPHQLGVLLWSLTKLSAGAYLGYWIDRSLFPYARPHQFFSLASLLESQDVSKKAGSQMRWQASMASLRRAIIIMAAILALGLGV